MKYETIGTNECETFHADGNTSWGTTFYDHIAVVIGVNKTTGDFLLLNYADGGGSVGCLSPVETKRYEQFFAADGEKSALVLGCNQGGMNANHYINKLKEQLAHDGIAVMDIDPAALQLSSGYGVYSQVKIDPVTHDVTIAVGSKEHVTKPFGDFIPTMPSDIPRIKKITDFCAAVSKDPGKLTGYTYDTAEGVTDRLRYLGYLMQQFQSALPADDAELAVLKKAFERLGEHETGMILRAEATPFPKLMKNYSSFMGRLYDALVEMASLDPKLMNATNRRSLDIMAGNLDACYARLGQIATQEGWPDVVADASAKLDGLRNLGGRKLAGG